MRPLGALAWMMLAGLSASVAGADEPLVKLHAVPFTDVQIHDSFWSPRQEINRTVSIPVNLEMLEKSGNLKNLELAAARATNGFTGPVFMDSDVYKALEAASYSLATHPDPALDKRHRRDHRQAGRGPAARRLSRQLLHREGAGPEVDQSPRQPRAVLRRAHDRGGRGALPGHGQDQLPRRRHQAGRPHRRDLRYRQAAGLSRPSRDRAGARSSSGRPPASGATSSWPASSSRTAAASSSPPSTTRRSIGTTAPTGRTTCRSATTGTSRATPSGRPTC